jgi:hypothetical protein
LLEAGTVEAVDVAEALGADEAQEEVAEVPADSYSY